MAERRELLGGSDLESEDAICHADPTVLRGALYQLTGNEYGGSAGNCPFGARKMWEWFRDPTGRYADVLLEESSNANSHVRPYFGQDLNVE